MTEINIRTKLNIDKTDKEVAVLLVRSVYKENQRLRYLLEKHKVNYCKNCLGNDSLVCCYRCDCNAFHCKKCIKNTIPDGLFEVYLNLDGWNLENTNYHVWLCQNCENKSPYGYIEVSGLEMRDNRTLLI